MMLVKTRLLYVYIASKDHPNTFTKPSLYLKDLYKVFYINTIYKALRGKKALYYPLSLSCRFVENIFRDPNPILTR